MTIKLTTLKTGQTFIAELDCTGEKEISLKQPVQVILQNTQQGPMMGFAPFLDFAEEFLTGIKISMDNVICITTPTTELVNQYTKSLVVAFKLPLPCLKMCL
jgi:hypothetical protein